MKKIRKYITWKEPQYLTYIKVPTIVEYDCDECGHVEKRIEWVKKGVGLTGYKVRRRLRTAQDDLNDFYSKKFLDMAVSPLTLFKKPGQTISFSRYSRLDDKVEE